MEEAKDLCFSPLQRYIRTFCFSSGVSTDSLYFNSIQSNSKHSQEMELELGLNISKTVDDFTSSAYNLLIAKDRSGPVFVSRETDSMFILTAHLKGYKREFVKIEINDDGTQIAISGEKPVQEMVMVGWRMYRKETEMRGFRKIFKIPDGVILDKIEARFNEEESNLTISMPKSVKGIRGIGVEELKDEQLFQKLPDSSEKKENLEAESSASENHDQGIRTVGSTRIAHDQVGQEERVEIRPPLVDKDQVVEGNTADEISPLERKMEGEDSEREEEDKSGHQSDKIETPGPKQVTDIVREVEGKEKIEKKGNVIERKAQEQEHDDNGREESGLEKTPEEEVHRDEPPGREEEETQGSQPSEKRSMICAPIIAGSAFLVSIIVLVIHLIRKSNPPPKKKN